MVWIQCQFRKATDHWEASVGHYKPDDSERFAWSNFLLYTRPLAKDRIVKESQDRNLHWPWLPLAYLPRTRKPAKQEPKARLFFKKTALSLPQHFRIYCLEPFPSFWFCGLLTKPCLTLVTPWNVTHQGPLSMGFPKQEYWSGLPLPPPEDLPDPGLEPWSPGM